MDYAVALRLLLERVSAKGRTIQGGWVDSDEVRHLDRDLRSILDGEDLRSEPREQFRVLSARMQLLGRPPDAPYGGSRVKKIRVQVGGVENADELADVLELEALTDRDDLAVFAAIGSDHLWEAIGLVDDTIQAEIGGGEQFELVVENRRLRPQAVVDIAARLATGRAGAAAGGGGDLSNARRAAFFNREGYEIVTAGALPTRLDIPVSSEDREWSEGRPLLVTHLKRERAPGLARAKKRNVLRQLGRLVCERCSLDPVKAFGSEAAAACLEVHHSRLEVAQMGEGTLTTLADVELLCANCHRLVHAFIREQVAATH
jgi:5-methylcytosine-specific restriction protein A